MIICNNRSNPACQQFNKMLLKRIKAGPEFMRQPHVAELSLCDYANRAAETADLIGVISAQSLDAVIKIAPSNRLPNC